MKKSAPYIFLLLLLAPVASQDNATFAIGEWEPFTSEAQDHAKILEILVREALALGGIEVDYEYYPWKRSYLYTENGMVDGTFPWIKTDEREELFIIHKEPLIVAETLLFHQKGLDFDWKEFSDLEEYRIGGTIGYADTQILTDFGLNVEAEKNEVLNFKKLVLGRIDIYPAAKPIAFHLLRNRFNESERALLTHHPKPLYEVEYYILFSKSNTNSQNLADLLDNGLMELKRNGRYYEILGDMSY